MAADGTGGSGPQIHFDVWGSRGSRSLEAGASRIGTHTPCFSLHRGDHLFVFEAGWGLTALGVAMQREERLREVRRIHVLVGHAHLDHWEGLKDVDWFWRLDNGLEVSLYANAETQEVIRRGFAHPSFVPLEVLSEISVASFTRHELSAGDELQVEECRLSTHRLHHYSGPPAAPNVLDAQGFRLEVPGGPVVTTLLDHEPAESSRQLEEAALSGCHLAVCDSHVLHRRQHWAHGSQEHTAALAADHPDTLFLAAHLNPALTDEELEEGRRLYASSLANYHLAEEGRSWRWDAGAGKFVDAAAEVVATGNPEKSGEREAMDESRVTADRSQEVERRRSKARHDLRTPVNHIIGYSELLLEEARDEGLEDFAADLQKIRDAGRRLLEMLDEVSSDPDLLG